MIQELNLKTVHEVKKKYGQNYITNRETDKNKRDSVLWKEVKGII